MDSNTHMRQMIAGLNHSPANEALDQRHWDDLERIKATEGSVDIDPRWADDARQYAAEEAAEQQDTRSGVSVLAHVGGQYELPFDTPAPLAPGQSAESRPEVDTSRHEGGSVWLDRR